MLHFNQQFAKNEIMTHHGRIGGLDNLSYGSGGNRYMKNTQRHSQSKLYGTIGGSDNTPIL